MKTKKLLLTCLLVLFAFCVNAQTVGHGENQKIVEYRETIGLDYSMHDFDTNRINAKVIGARLARLLYSLEVNYTQGYYNRTLASILAEQLDNPAYRFVPIKKIKTQKITKKGDEITILLKTTFKSPDLGKQNTILTFRFFQGVSDSDSVNKLFYTLGLYLKDGDN